MSIINAGCFAGDNRNPTTPYTAGTMNIVYVKVQDPKVADPKCRVFSLANNGTKPENLHEGDCIGCGCHLKFDGQLFDHDILLLACSGCGVKVLDFPTPAAFVPSAMKEKAESNPDKPETCPDCDGPMRGRGYAHNDGCPVLKVHVVEKCSVCGGPKRGRGYIHTPNCSIKTTPKIDTDNTPKSVCPKCGGPKRGRGFTHNPECAEK
jgi:hypothetical protein